MKTSDTALNRFGLTIGQMRLMIALAVVLYPVWGLVYKFIEPNLNDDFNKRASIVLFFVALFGVSFIKKLQNYFSLGYITGIWLLMTHYTYLVFINSGHHLYLLGGFITVSALIMALPSVKSATFFALYTILISSLMTYTVESFEINRVFYVFGLFTILSIGLAIQYIIHSFVKALVQSNQKNQTILSNLNEGILVIEKDGTVIDANQRFVDIFEYPRAVFIGQKIISPNWPRENEDGSQMSENELPAMLAFNTKKPVRDIVMKSKKMSGSSIWTSVNAIPILDEITGEVLRVITSYQDITEKREKDQLLREQQAMVAGAARMSSLGVMASGIAHEINNPLAIISGRINQIKRAAEVKPVSIDEIGPMIQNIQTTISRISKIIQGLRSFARDGKADPFVATPLASVVDEAVALCKELLQRNDVKLIVEVDSSYTAEIRSVQISQVLVNLIQNAIDAIEPLSKKWIKIAAWATPTDIFLEVEDSGSGIPPEIKHKILDPFFTTKEVGKGTGLGLSISLGIVRDHKGKLLIPDGVPNTKFVIVLPIKQPLHQGGANEQAA